VLTFDTSYCFHFSLTVPLRRVTGVAIVGRNTCIHGKPVPGFDLMMETSAALSVPFAFRNWLASIPGVPVLPMQCANASG
jgi:hypothetical protein